MIKTTLKIDGMMCGMCESHMNDLIRKNFKVKKVTSSAYLIGLKENVIIGKLIPASTGMKRYRSVKLNTDAHMIEEPTEAEDENAEITLSEGAEDSVAEEVLDLDEGSDEE